jgi:RHS repeat-associated protein
LFVYDGWNLIEELNGSGTVEKCHVWGLDLSNSLQGAGGIGGLMATVDPATSKVYYFQYDANGNVGQLVDRADGSIVAHYEYDPFGNLTNATGFLADVNPFKFSTKYHDYETGLIYYGYRYYSPELGRWLSRDPLGEDGSVNLYLFAYNNSLYFIDPFGLNPIENVIKSIAKSLDKSINAAIDVLGWKDANLAKNIQSRVQWQVEAGGLYNLNETISSAFQVLYITSIGGEYVAGYLLLAGPQGLITGTGGLILLADAADKTQALITGRNQFKEWVESMPISDKEKKTILCAKEISVVIIEGAGFSTLGSKSAQQQRLLNVLHQRELGLDPATKSFRAIEAQVATRLESQLGRRLSRDLSGAADWVDDLGRTFDAVGPIPSQHFNLQSVTNSIGSHLNKQGLNKVVVDLSGLSSSQASQVSRYISNLPSSQANKIMILGR